MLPQTCALSTAEGENDDSEYSNSDRERQLLAIFGDCDLGGKGYLCVEDIAALVASDVGSGVDAHAIFDLLDGDRDGKVTWEDFRGGWVRSTGGASSPPTSARAATLKEIFFIVEDLFRLDTNQTG